MQLPKLYTIPFVMLLFIGFTACDNGLEEVVYSETTEQNYNYSEQDFRPNIAGVYASIGNSDILGRWQTQELTAHNVVIPANVTGWDDGGIYKNLHLHNWNSESPQISSLWNKYFSGVILANVAIEKVVNDVIPAPSPEVRTTGLAELRTLRAYYYWMLMDNFGDVPLVTEPTQDLPEKASRQEVYDFVVSELKEAIPNLSEVQGGELYARMNKWAGKTLLANVYLNAEVYTGTPRWEECLEQVNDIINSGQVALSADYKDPFQTTGVQSSQEVLFTIPYDFERNFTGNYLFMNSWHSELQKRFQTTNPPNAAGGPKGVTQFIDTYQEGDTRLEDSWLMGQQFDANGDPLYCIYDLDGEPLIFTKDLPDGLYTNEREGYRMGKYEVEVGSEWSSNTDVPLFRYAEVLLMKAECLLRLGRSGAGELVTQVRQRAFDDPAEARVTDQELMEDSSFEWGYVEDYEVVAPGDQSPVEFGRMFDEWGWEFAWEGYARRNMIRFGLFTTKSWLSHEPNGEYRSVFPIPFNVVNSNPNLEQNPNY